MSRHDDMLAKILAKLEGGAASTMPAEEQGGSVVNRRGLVIDFHALRHTYATWMVQAGVTPVVCQRAMRHSDIRLTLMTYAKAPEKALREAAELMAKFRTGSVDSSNGSSTNNGATSP